MEHRKAIILRAVVLEYVDSAEPVGSEILVGRYDLGVKPATVRNEMAELLELGFLKQPHTSAGRIPSDTGYRFFVDELTGPTELTESSRESVHDATAQNDTLIPVLRDTVRTVSRIVNMLSVATTVRDQDVEVKMIIVSALGPSQALLIMALSNGHVENRMLECPAGTTLADIGRVNELVTALVGKNIRTIKKSKLPTSDESGPPSRLASVVWSQIRAIARTISRGKMVTDGEEFLFAQPEYRKDVGSLAALLSELMEGETLYEALAPGENIQPVTIGAENKAKSLHQFSVVRQTFYVGGQEAGVIAVVGPTRMKYDMSISLVDFTAKALTHSLNRFLG